MVQQFRLRPQFTQRVQDQIGEYISRAQIDAALATFVDFLGSDWGEVRGLDAFTAPILWN